MKIASLRTIAIGCLAMLSVSGKISYSKADETSSLGIFESVKEQYDELPPAGKFACGAALGFTGTRIVINKAVGFVKVAGACFIASEALNAAGALERIPKENMQTAQMVKQSVVNVVDDFRVQVRRRLKPEGFRESFDGMMNKERMATMGLASGAFVSCML